ncbi:Olfactory receptor 5M11 [Aix galericulata]|nr:Olfactory receptor 5M11 [Aix galericulata]
MAEENHTSVAEFILEGLTDQPEMKAALFVVFLLIYIITLLGNMGIIIIIRGDPRLHTSMYFFLGSLSVVDICFSSVIVPKTLVNFLSERTISFAGCTCQTFFYIVFVTTECFLLAVMAYDRYVAICNPLLYSAVMTRRLCVQLVVGSYIGGILNAIIQMTFIIRLPFCSSKVINHFFCDVPPLLALSCANTYINEMILFSLAGVIELSTISIILVSYIFISCAILRIRSAEGRKKAFSTCVSHLTAVTLLYGTTIFMYLRPSSSYSLNTDKMVSVFYTVVIPMLNPLIYSLRNQVVKDALRRRAERITVGFFLLGFTSQEDLQVICFVLFLAIYVVSLVGNLGVITLIRINSCLHTPMYFFLSHLSLLDACYSSTIIPQALLNFLVKRKAISFMRCAAQLFSFATCATAECYVLAAMAYDRYVAICNPLLYPVVMSRQLCVGMLVGAYLAGVLSSAIHTVSIFHLPFCHSRRINHFFCDGPPLLALSCSDAWLSGMVVSAVVGFNVLSTTVFILVSYWLVLSAVLQIRSVAGRHRAFSTCASHLVSVSLYYGSSLFMYLRPSSAATLDHDKVVSVLYVVVVPMLNPLIYSLRNAEMKNAIRKAQALETFLFGTSNISFVGCFAQIHVFLMLVTCECFLLGVMAYDRYAAVCQPLRYTALMSPARCYRMTMLVYATGFLTSLVHTVLAGRLAFCRTRSIDHFFCELPSLLHLSCSSTRPNHILQVCSAELNILGSILVILVSYTCILYTVLRMPSAGTRMKVFSTCTSHLAAVTIFYVPGLVTYMLPSKARPQGEEKLVSVFYTAVTPLLNPLVYSLRNREVKGALRRLCANELEELRICLSQ